MNSANPNVLSQLTGNEWNDEMCKNEVLTIIISRLNLFVIGNLGVGTSMTFGCVYEFCIYVLIYILHMTMLWLK